MIKKNDCTALDLVQLLADLDESHAELCAVVDDKIRHMRACNSAEITRCVEQEQRIVEHIGSQEKRRRLLTNRVVRGFGIRAEKVRGMTASELAKKMPARTRARFLEGADRLRETLTRTARRNRIATRLSGAMVAHFDTMLSAMTVPEEQRDSYSRQGRKLRSSPARLFETVG